MKTKILIGTLFIASIMLSESASGQDSRAAVVINLAGETCQVCEDDGAGGCQVVVDAEADRGVAVDKTSGANNAPQILKLTCRVPGLANDSGRGLLFDVFNTNGTQCVVIDRDFNTYLTENWRQSLTPNGVGLLTCLLRGSLF